MVFQQGGCVYILTNQYHNVFYVAVTSHLTGRIWDHKNKTHPNSFTAKYNCNKLMYYEFYSRIEEAIAVEKTLKGGNRQSKLNLIKTMNPTWLDLFDRLINE
jgi:putative endonuclease